MPKDKTTVIFFAYFDGTNKIVAVDYLKIAKHADDFEMVTFTAFL